MIATESSIPFIFQEFQDYIKAPDRRFVADTLAAIGLCAQRLPTVSRTCLDGLLALTRRDHLTCDLSLMDGEEGVLAQAIMSIKAIIKRDPSNYEKVIIQLIRSLESIKVPAARAMIVWMVGEYNSVGQIIPRMLVSVLKYLARCFTSEAVETKHQILSTAVKVVLFATGEDSSTNTKVLSYILQLSKCDLNYDIRDRARVLEKLLSFHVSVHGLEDGVHVPQNMEIQHMLAESIFLSKRESAVPMPDNCRFYLPGSLSLMVLHAAPGYEPLPVPGSLLHDDVVHGLKTTWGNTTNSESSKMSHADSLSGASDEDTGSSYRSRHSLTTTGESGGTSSASDADEEADPLIQLSDVGFDSSKPNGSTEENSSTSFSDNLGGLMSKKSLESWLDGKPSISDVSTSKDKFSQSSKGRISLKDIGARVNRRTYTLLDPTHENGLKVYYSFSNEVSSMSHSLICVELSFENCSSEPLTAITLIEDSSQSSESTKRASEAYESSSTAYVGPTVVPMEEIASLGPGQITKRTLQVHFHHHLLPLKLDLYCDGKKLPVKLHPDIGYFVKAIPMDVETFKAKESQLPGMFEYNRSFKFTDHIMEIENEKGPTEDNLLIVCRSLASKMLSNANLFLVSVDMPVAANFDDASGLCFRFSGEMLSNLIPCLVTITVEGKCSETLDISTKVNCEETIFGLNFLNRIVAILS